MSKLKNPKPVHTEEQLRGLVAYCDGFLTSTVELLGQVDANTTCWPSYMWEEVSPYEVVDASPLAQDLYDLSVRIGNINLRLQGLLMAMGPVSK